MSVLVNVSKSLVEQTCGSDPPLALGFPTVLGNLGLWVNSGTTSCRCVVMDIKFSWKIKTNKEKGGFFFSHKTFVLGILYLFQLDVGVLQQVILIVFELQNRMNYCEDVPFWALQH